MNEWQPIETAPKDGTVVLVWPPTWPNRSCSTARWNSDEYANRPAPFWDRDDGLLHRTTSRAIPPTLWQPLPPPPNAVSQQAEE